MATEALSSDLEDSGLYPLGEVFNFFFSLRCNCTGTLSVLIEHTCDLYHKYH